MKEKHISLEQIDRLARTSQFLLSGDPDAAHLALCLHCKSLLEDARFTKEVLAPLHRCEKTPRSVRQNIEHILRTPSPSSSWLERVFRPGWIKPALSFTAVFLLFLGVLFIKYSSFQVLKENDIEVAWVLDDLEKEYLDESFSIPEGEMLLNVELNEVSEIALD